MKADFPEIREFVRLSKNVPLVENGDKAFAEKKFFRADPAFFKIFDAEFISGSENPLGDPYSLVLNKTTALKYFGKTEIIGKPLTIDGIIFHVGAVVEDWPEESHFSFDILGSFQWHFLNNARYHNEWIHTYILLNPSTDIKQLESKFPEFIKKQPVNPDFGEVALQLQSLSDIHLHSARQGELSVNGEIIYIYIFASAAALIMLVTVFNFINLTTAGAVYRIKEIGLRKIMGAARYQLIKQFIGESLILTLASFLLAIVLTESFLVFVNRIFETNLSVFAIFVFRDFSIIVGAVLGIGVLASLYPSFYLSSLLPKEIFKKSTDTKSSKSVFRSALVVAQFIISITLLVGAYIIKDQLHFIMNKEVGYDRHQIMLISMGNSQVKQKYNTFKNKLLQYDFIESVSATSGKLGVGDTWIGTFFPEGGGPAGENYIVPHILVDHDFLKTYNINLKAGRDFSKEFSDSINAFILNEAAVKDLGWENNPIGKQLTTFGTKTGPVVGVVKDFHFESLRSTIKPLIIHIAPRYFNYASVKIKPGRHQEAIEAIKMEWKQLEPKWPVQYSFLDSDFETVYKAYSRMSDLVSLFTFFSMFFGCLGLWGLTLFTVKLKIKEIGIRKVLGAKIHQIVFTLAKPVLKLIMLAIIIGLPSSYYLSEKWLQNFAYHVDLEAWVFIAAATIALLIALLTVSFQSIKAALVNPVESLRNE